MADPASDSLREHLTRAGSVRSEAKAKAARANGKKAAESMTAEQRSERAKKAVAAREAKKKSAPEK